MSDSTSLSAVFLPDLSLGRLPPNTRIRTVSLSLFLGPFPSCGLYAWNFRDVNRVASSALPLIPPFSWDSIPNSNKCGKSELSSVFEGWDDSPTLVDIREDDIRNLLILPKTLGHTPLSTTSDANDSGPSLDSESDVHEESLTRSPQTPSLILEHMERLPKPQLSIDTTFKSFQGTFTSAPSLVFLDSPCLNPLIYNGPSDS